MGDTLHVLLLDDNPDDWVLVRRQLSGEFPDFQMEPVTNTEGFTQALEVGGFDLVIADQQLSWNDGLAVLQAVKARWPHCPVIMLTIRASQEGLIESMKAGLDGYVLKSPKALMSLPAMVKAVRQRAELSRRRHALETYYKVVRTMNNSMRGTTEHPRAEEAVPRLPEQTGQLMAELDGPNYAAGLIGAAQLYEQVRQAETRYRDLYENAPDGYSAIDTNGVIREMNATQLNWLAYSREEVIGQVCYEDLLTPAGRRKFGHLLERCQREGHLENVELELVCKDGRLLPVRLNVVAMRDAEGRYLGCRATARDITKEKELEAQLLQAQKLESLGTLVGGIAHDFNNMLTGILGYTQLLLRTVEPTDETYESVQRIELLSERAAQMVGQLLAFSRQDVSQKKCLALHPFLRQIGKLLERMIPENIELELNLAPETLTVHADPTQLQQVVMNLIVNARDAMLAGGRLRIKTTVVQVDEEFTHGHPDIQPGDYIRLSISDTGVGIPPEIRSRVFDPFFTTKEVGKGTGLGLSVAYGIVKSHGGAVTVESQPRQGTTFHIYLPLSEALVAEVAHSPVGRCATSSRQ